MSKRQLVDVQLTRGGAPVGDRYTSAVNPSDQGDRRGLFQDALTHASVTADGHQIQVWHRDGGELFTYPAA